MVDFEKKGDLVFDIADNLENRLHQFTIVGCSPSRDSFIEEEKERTGIHIPLILKQISTFGNAPLDYSKTFI